MNPDVALVERVLSGDLALPAAVDSSAIARALGMTILQLDPSSGDATLSFTPSDIFLQGAGVLQGGAVAGMLDFAMIVAVMTVMPQGAIPATTNLDIAYFRPALPGTFEARARIQRRSRSIMFAQATLSSAANAEIAAATSTAFIRSDQT